MEVHGSALGLSNAGEVEPLLVQLRLTWGTIAMRLRAWSLVVFTKRVGAELPGAQTHVPTHPLSEKLWMCCSAPSRMTCGGRQGCYQQGASCACAHLPEPRTCGEDTKKNSLVPRTTDSSGLDTSGPMYSGA